MPKLLTLEQSATNTDLNGEVEQQNQYYFGMLSKQQEIETAPAMDQTQ